MQPAIAEKGLMVIDGYAYGTSGHAARNEGVNAIYEALDDLIWLRDYQFRKESRLLGRTKMSVTVLPLPPEEDEEMRTQGTLLPTALLDDSRGSSAGAEMRGDGHETLRLPHPQRPGIDALPVV